MTRTELADINVLFAALNADHQDHDKAIDWLRSVPQFATTPITETGLVRLLMNGTVMNTPATIGQATASLASLRALPNATFVADATSLADTRAITGHVTGTKQVVDTHLLNLAVSCGHVLTTFDRRQREGLPARHRHHVNVLNGKG